MENCNRCGEEEKREEHTCPFRTEINDNKDTCTCCKSCTHDCAEDI